jgi:hypothetical protein
MRTSEEAEPPAVLSERMERVSWSGQMFFPDPHARIREEVSKGSAYIHADTGLPASSAVVG